MNNLIYFLAGVPFGAAGGYLLRSAMARPWALARGTWLYLRSTQVDCGSRLLAQKIASMINGERDD